MTKSAKFITATGSAAVGFVVFDLWYESPFPIIWPGLALSRLGLPYAWIPSTAIIVGGFLYLGLRARSHSSTRVVAVSLAASATYCLFAFLFAAHAPVPLPIVTRYDSIPPQRISYLQGFEWGYRVGTLGQISTHCFAPEAETQGFYDGSYQGSIVWHRALGMTMSERTKRLFGISAARDGIRLEP